MIKRQLVERHGRMSELHLYKGVVTADTEMTNGAGATAGPAMRLPVHMLTLPPTADSGTLADYGIVGKRRSEVPETVVIHYNFVPYEHDNALLLATHTRDRVGVA